MITANPIGKKVPVYDNQGRIVGEVSPGATSVAAAKILKVPSAEFSYKFGVGGWIPARPRKWNPSQSELADIGYEHFHGKPSLKITTDDLDWPPPAELEEQFGPFGELPEDLACLGELLAVMYEDERSLEDEVIEFTRPYPFLATDWERQGKETLYIVGGDYEVEVWEDFICGPLIWVLYQTVKSFDDFEPTEYKHRLVEPMPTLAHNQDGNQLYIFRGDSNFRIDRSRPTSLGIDG